MADGLGLLIVMIGMVMLVQWLLQNDKAPDEKTRGLYALRGPEQDAGAERGRRQGRLGSQRIAAKPAPAAAAPHFSPAPPATRADARLPFQRD